MLKYSKIERRRCRGPDGWRQVRIDAHTRKGKLSARERIEVPARRQSFEELDM